MKQKILIFIFLEGMCFSQDGSLIGIKKNSKKILRINSADGVGLAWGLIGEILDQLEFLIREKRFLYGNTKIRNHIVSCLKKFILLLYPYRERDDFSGKKTPKLLTDRVDRFLTYVWFYYDHKLDFYNKKKPNEYINQRK